MGAIYAEAYRSTNQALGNWRAITWDNEVVDAAGVIATPYFTAPANGFLWFQPNVIKTVNASEQLFCRGYLNDSLLNIGQVANSYSGGGAKDELGGPLHTTEAIVQTPMSLNDTFKADFYNDTGTLLGGTTHQYRWLFLPDGEMPQIEMYGRSANSGPYTERAAFANIENFDLVHYQVGGWRDVGNDSFTMPHDGILWLTYSSSDSTSVNQQRSSNALKLFINGSSNAKWESGNGGGQSGWQQQVDSVFLPVSSGDVISFQWRWLSWYGDTYEHIGFTAADPASKSTVILRLFAT